MRRPVFIQPTPPSDLSPTGPLRSALAAGTGAIMAACLAAAGCAGPTDDAARLGDRRDPVASATTQSGIGLAELGAPESGLAGDDPLVAGGQPGLEAHWWLAMADERATAAALAEFAEGFNPIDPITLTRWRDEGLRVLAVPIDRLAELQRRLPPTRHWNRAWLGEPVEWAELIRGRRVWEGRPVAFGRRERRLPAGVLRLLGRGWSAPLDYGDAALRVELAVQLERPRPSRPSLREAIEDRTATPAGSLVVQDERDLFFDGLSLTAVLPPSHALVVVEGDADADWLALARESSRPDSAIEPPARDDAGLRGDESDEAADFESPRSDVGAGGPADATPSPEDADGDFAALDDVFDAPLEEFGPRRDAGAAIFGPRREPTVSVGAAMLNAEDAAGREMKAVLVLIPRVGGDYRLLP